MHNKNIFLWLVCLAGAHTCVAQTFQGVPFAPGTVSNQSFRISDDGSTVVSDDNIQLNRRVTRWRIGGALDVLNPLPGFDLTYSPVVSADGSVVAGTVDAVLGTAAGFRWTQSTGMTALTGMTTSYGISADGSTVVGFDDTASGLAVRWTAATGVQSLAPFAGTPLGIFRASVASAATTNGALVFGTVSVQITSGMNPEYRGTPFVWDAVNGSRIIRELDGSITNNGVSDCTPDGSVLCGFRGPIIGEPLANRLFRWTATGGYQYFDFTATQFSNVRPHITADGSVIVTGFNYWSQTGGMRLLTSVLNEAGCNFTGWSGIEAVDVSADGRTIVGNGINPLGQSQGWVATIPAPGAAGFLVATLACGGVLNSRRRRRN